MYPQSFQRLIDALRRLPQVGNKAAERYAYAVLDWKDSETDNFIEAIKTARALVKPCSLCFHLSDKEVCDICEDDNRDQGIICVVNSSRDVIAMEKTKEYNGLYHVLQGEISPAKGVLPENLTIKQLLDRLDERVREIIIATNATVDGETTALYLSKVVGMKNIPVSRLAHGIPMGAQLDYADELTLAKAIEGRIKY